MLFPDVFACACFQHAKLDWNASRTCLMQTPLKRIATSEQAPNEREWRQALDVCSLPELRARQKLCDVLLATAHSSKDAASLLGLAGKGTPEPLRSLLSALDERGNGELWQGSVPTNSNALKGAYNEWVSAVVRSAPRVSTVLNASAPPALTLHENGELLMTLGGDGKNGGADMWALPSAAWVRSARENVRFLPPVAHPWVLDGTNRVDDAGLKRVVDRLRQPVYWMEMGQSDPPPPTAVWLAWRQPEGSIRVERRQQALEAMREAKMASQAEAPASHTLTMLRAPTPLTPHPMMQELHRQGRDFHTVPSVGAMGLAECQVFDGGLQVGAWMQAHLGNGDRDGGVTVAVALRPNLAGSSVWAQVTRPLTVETTYALLERKHPLIFGGVDTVRVALKGTGTPLFVAPPGQSLRLLADSTASPSFVQAVWVRSASQSPVDIWFNGSDEWAQPGLCQADTQEGISMPLWRAAALMWGGRPKQVQPTSFRIVQVPKHSVSTAAARLQKMPGFMGAFALPHAQSKPKGKGPLVKASTLPRGDQVWSPRLQSAIKAGDVAPHEVVQHLETTMAQAIVTPSPWLQSIGQVRLPMRFREMAAAVFAPVQWPEFPPQQEGMLGSDALARAEANMVTLMRRVFRQEHSHAVSGTLLAKLPPADRQSLQAWKPNGAPSTGVPVSRVSKWQQQSVPEKVVHCNNWRDLLADFRMPQMPHPLMTPVLAVLDADSDAVVIFSPVGVSVSHEGDTKAVFSDAAPAHWGEDEWPVNGELCVRMGKPEAKSAERQRRVRFKDSVSYSQDEPRSLHGSAMASLSHKLDYDDTQESPVSQHDAAELPHMPLFSFIAMKFFGVNETS